MFLIFCPKDTHKQMRYAKFTLIFFIAGADFLLSSIPILNKKQRLLFLQYSVSADFMPFKDLAKSFASNFRRRFFLAIESVLFVLSLLTVAAITVDYGFVLDEGEKRAVSQVCDFARWFYFLVFVVRLIVYRRKIQGRTVVLTSIFGIALLLSLLPDLFALHGKEGGLVHAIYGIISGEFYRLLVLSFFSLLELSKGLVAFIGRRTNPALLMASCFAVLILFGALLLLLPRSTLDGVRISVIDALFVSTSAVCVTGLSTVEVARTFSFDGLCVILLLVQLGGLGVMTITSFFALFFVGDTGFFGQFALRDMVGSDVFGSLVSSLLYVMGFTFAVEIAGALFLWLSVHGTLGMTLGEELFFALFHSVSAFCNAGFSTLEGNLGNEVIFSGHNAFYVVVSLLVVAGGIGFPILVNFKEWISCYLLPVAASMLGVKRKRHRFNHIVNLNTRIVVSCTLLLLTVGTLLLAVFEWDGVFGNMPAEGRVVQAFFCAAVPRTAGFNSVEPDLFSPPALIVYMLLMWIGGASQSTAGGVKVNSVAVAIAGVRAAVGGRGYAELFGRQVSTVSLLRASVAIFCSILVVSLSFLVLVLVEPGISPKGLLFETVSAYSTVGASLGVTSQLGTAGKAVVIFLMFVGRVGLVTVLMGFATSGIRRFRYPVDDVIIN